VWVVEAMITESAGDDQGAGRRWFQRLRNSAPSA
jgi:hypothetical protein